MKDNKVDNSNYFYCKYGGVLPLCAKCKRNPEDSSRIKTFLVPRIHTKQCEDFLSEETNIPTGYGKYVDDCLNKAAKRFFSNGEDAYSVADLFHAGVKCGVSLQKIEQPSEDFKEEFNNFCVHGNIRNPNFEGPFGYDDIRKTAIHFVDWQKEQIINKARKWLAGNVINYIWKGSGGGIGISDDFFIDFEKAMEDNQ